MFRCYIISILATVAITACDGSKVPKSIKDSTSAMHTNVIPHSDVDIDKIMEEETKELDHSTPRNNPARIELNTINSINFDAGLNAEDLRALLGEPLFEYWSSDLQANATIDRARKKFLGIVYMLKSDESSSIVFLLNEGAASRVIRIYSITNKNDSNEMILLWPKSWILGFKPEVRGTN